MHSSSIARVIAASLGLGGASGPKEAENSLLGGIVDTSLGVLITVVVSAARGWTPFMASWLPFATPMLGTMVGLVFGAFPSLKAASIEPIQALRSSV